ESRLPIGPECCPGRFRSRVACQNVIGRIAAAATVVNERERHETRTLFPVLFYPIERLAKIAAMATRSRYADLRGVIWHLCRIESQPEREECREQHDSRWLQV